MFQRHVPQVHILRYKFTFNHALISQLLNLPNVLLQINVFEHDIFQHNTVLTVTLYAQELNISKIYSVIVHRL